MQQTKTYINMTRENKELLLKDLCSRLPYFTKVQIKNKIVVLNSICDDDGYHFNFICDNKEGVNIEQIKPYLFPLSSMTDEQVKEMQEIVGNPSEACVSVNTLGLELWLNPVDTDPTINLDVLFELQDWLNKNKFDYRGIIPKGLALDATGLNIY